MGEGEGEGGERMARSANFLAMKYWGHIRSVLKHWFTSNFLPDKFHDIGTPIINVDYAEKHKKGVWGPEANQKPLTFNSARLPHRPRYIAVVQCIGLYQNWITQTLMFRPTPKWNVTCFLRFWTKRLVTKGFPMGVILRKYLEVGGEP